MKYIPSDDQVIVGSDDADTLTGGEGPDFIYGMGGDDSLYGYGGDDTMDGGDGADVLRGGDGNDTLIGGAGDDYLRGGAGVDSYDGGDGYDRVSFFEADATQGVVVDLRTQTVLNDGFGNTETMSSIEAIGAGTRFADTFYGDDGDNLILVGGHDTAYGFGGNDTFQVDDAPAVIDGGDGVDTISMFTQTRLVDSDGDGVADYETTTNGAFVDLTAHSIRDDGFGGSGTILNVENVGGSAGDDTLLGDAGDNVLSGLDGADYLRGGAGNDTLIGGAGDDYLRGGSGVDSYDGGDGFDRVSFYEADATQGVVVDLRSQTVLNDGFGNTETMTSIEAIGSGTRFADTFYGNDADNLILVGGHDTAYGFGGNDTFQVDDAPALIDGADGVDTISMFTQSRMVDSNGDGVADYETTTNGVHVDLAAHLISDDGFGGTGTIVNVENVGGSSGDDNLAGDSGANVISGFDGGDILDGRAGDDVLNGGAGDDFLIGGAGVDTFVGGDGFDVVSFFAADATQGVVADLRDQTISNDGFGHAETMSSVEGLGLGTVFADTYYGNDAANSFVLGRGDSLQALGGDDYIQIYDAPALVDGGLGSDTVTFAEMRMVLADGVPTFEAADHGVWIDLAAHAIRDDGFGGSGTIVNVENVFGSALDDTLVGDAGDNLLSGLDGADYIRGGAGNDTLIGGAGDDYLRGGSGVDSYDGGDGFDRVSFYEADATQGVVVDLRTQTVLNDGFGNVEHMSSIEALGAGTRFADTFYGDDNANLIYVDRGDTAYGFGGDDTFEVGAQAPALLDGGDGVDTLAYFALDTGATHGVTVDLAAQAILDDGLGQSGVVRGFENLGGSDLNDVLRGDAGANRIQGFDGDDILTGGEGADTFVYGRAHYGDGHDQITDFQSGVDHIEFGGLHGVHGFTDLTLGHDAAGDVTISWGTAGETITLLGVHDVTAADFLFG